MAYIPEFKEMLSAGRQFVNGEINVLQLRGYAVGCVQAAKLFGAPAQVFQMADEWNKQIEICWDEWGLVPEDQAITEDELRRYIAAELDVSVPQ